MVSRKLAAATFSILFLASLGSALGTQVTIDTNEKWNDRITTIEDPWVVQDGGLHMPEQSPAPGQSVFINVSDMNYAQTEFSFSSSGSFHWANIVFHTASGGTVGTPNTIVNMNSPVDTSSNNVTEIELRTTDQGDDLRGTMDSYTLTAPDTAPDVETGTFSNGISFSEDYFETPESLSCLASYALIMGDCWLDLGIITWGDSSTEIFIEDLKANGAIIEEDRKEVLNSLEVLNNQSYGIAQSGAKIKTIDLLNNGTSETDAESQVRSDVRDFWTERQSNLVTQHQLEVETFKQTIVTADGLGASYSNMFDSNYSGFIVEESQYSLVNGSEKPVYDIYSEDGTLIHSFTDSSSVGLETVDGDQYLAGSVYADNNNALVNLQSNAYQSANQLVSDIYGNYSQGELTVAENIGPLEETRLLATNYADSGASAYLAGTYRQMGLASDFNSSFEISYQNQDMNSSETATGSLFARESDYPDGFEVGENYSAEEKLAYLIYQPEGEDSSQALTLDGEFTVDQIYDTSSGEEINSTEIQSNNFYSSNITQLQEQLSGYQERIEEISSNGGGGGGNGGSGFNQGLIAIVAILAIVLIGVTQV